jgi:PTH1 family peptidyl-tRNA hydrolase
LRVVAGLGNPGASYRHTRHNAGFRVIDLLVARAEACRPMPEQPRGVVARARRLVARVLGVRVLVPRESAGPFGGGLVPRESAGPSGGGPSPGPLTVAGDLEAWLAEASVGGEPVLLVKPLAFVNRSGVPIARVLAACGASASDLVVVVDDVALELGTVRVRARGRHGGHNGLRSVIDEIGTEDFVRVRIGVRRGGLPPELAAYVLAEVPPDDVPVFEAALGRAADAVACVLREGPAAAMDRFNGWRA